MVIKELFENFSEDTIRSFVSKNSDYYLKKWKYMLEKNSKVSWNWPAFFFGFWWFLYRKMFLYGFLVFLYTYFVAPSIAKFLVLIMGIIIKSTFFIDILFRLFWFLAIIPVPIFANYIYATHIYSELIRLQLLFKNEKEKNKFTKN